MKIEEMEERKLEWRGEQKRWMTVDDGYDSMYLKNNFSSKKNEDGAHIALEP
jgi:hypothetical protein